MIRKHGLNRIMSFVLLGFWLLLCLVIITGNKELNGFTLFALIAAPIVMVIGILPYKFRLRMSWYYRIEKYFYDRGWNKNLDIYVGKQKSEKMMVEFLEEMNKREKEINHE